MPGTITAFYTFTPNTVAQSGQVNTNFSNFRGTLIPINETTATADDNTFDLGTTDRRWANAYIAQNVYLGIPNTTGSWRIKIGDTTTSLFFEYYSSTAYVTKGSFEA